MTINEAIRESRRVMDAANPDGRQLPRGEAGQALVEHLGLLCITCGYAPEVSMCISKPLFMLHPYEVADPPGWTLP